MNQKHKWNTIHVTVDVHFIGHNLTQSEIKVREISIRVQKFNKTSFIQRIICFKFNYMSFHVCQRLWDESIFETY